MKNMYLADLVVFSNRNKDTLKLGSSLLWSQTKLTKSTAKTVLFCCFSGLFNHDF